MDKTDIKRSGTVKFKSDIDIDFSDRQQVLDLLDVTPASIIRDGKLVKHNTGVYATDIPVDPFTGYASLDYEAAESRGYMKLDFLNVNLYKQVRDEAHLVELMREPDWTKLYDKSICDQLMHVNGHYDLLLQMPEPIDTIARLAMFLAIIRPAKRHLAGKTWKEVGQTVWQKPNDDSYYFKKAHGIAYSQLVVVNMNLLEEKTNLLSESA
jgi:hypothetical protein